MGFGIKKKQTKNKQIIENDKPTEFVNTINELEIEIMKAIDELGEDSYVDEIAYTLNVPVAKLKYYLPKLMKKGFVEKKKEKYSDRVYHELTNLGVSYLVENKYI